MSHWSISDQNKWTHRNLLSLHAAMSQPTYWSQLARLHCNPLREGLHWHDSRDGQSQVWLVMPQAFQLVMEMHISAVWFYSPSYRLPVLYLYTDMRAVSQNIIIQNVKLPWKNAVKTPSEFDEEVVGNCLKWRQCLFLPVYWQHLFFRGHWGQWMQLYSRLTWRKVRHTSYVTFTCNHEINIDQSWGFSSFNIWL